MGEMGTFLIGVANVVFAAIAVYNLSVHTKHAKAIAELEKNTNSIKDALVAVTGENAFQKGVQSERDRVK